MHRFLKIPHWMIFGFCFGLPLLAIYFIAPRELVEQEILFRNFVYLFPIKLAAFSLYLGYFWSVGVVFQKKHEKALRRQYTFFTFAMLIIIGCFVWSTKLRIGEFLGTWNLNRSIGWDESELSNLSYSILYSISLFVIIYLSYYAAKTYKTVEQQQKVKFKQFIFEFLLFLFLPIGIWFLQPKINQLYLQDEVKK